LGDASRIILQHFFSPILQLLPTLSYCNNFTPTTNNKKHISESRDFSLQPSSRTPNPKAEKCQKFDVNRHPGHRVIGFAG
jgi:hypothetical protein